MFLERLVHGVEKGMANLGRHLLKNDPRTQLREDMLQASSELAARQKALTHSRAELDATRTRINETQAAVALLMGRVGVAVARGAADQAWRGALDLDKARRRLAEDQANLPKQEQLCITLDLQVRFKMRRLARIQDQLYSRV